MKRLGTQHPLCLLNRVALKLASLFWTKLGSVTAEQDALVARVVSQAEIDRTPEAKTAMDKQKLFDKSCWLHEKVPEYRVVAAEARSVFQGNRVSDEHNDHAIFAELGSCPASMEAAKASPGMQNSRLMRDRPTCKLSSKPWKPLA